MKRFDKDYTEVVQGLRALTENSAGTLLSVNLQAGSNLRNDLVWPAGECYSEEVIFQPSPKKIEHVQIF